MRAAWRLEAKEGIAKLEKLAKWLEREHPDAADSLREGMEECFTINRMDIPPSLHRCLASTNLIENPHSGVRRRTRRVCRWRDKPMAKRWAAAAMLATEKNFRRVITRRSTAFHYSRDTVPIGPQEFLLGGMRLRFSLEG